MQLQSSTCEMHYALQTNNPYTSSNRHTFAEFYRDSDKPDNIYRAIIQFSCTYGHSSHTEKHMNNRSYIFGYFHLAREHPAMSNYIICTAIFAVLHLVLSYHIYLHISTHLTCLFCISNPPTLS